VFACRRRVLAADDVARTLPRAGRRHRLGPGLGVGQPRRDHVDAIVDDDHYAHRDVEGAERGVQLVADLLANGALVRLDLGLGQVYLGWSGCTSDWPRVAQSGWTSDWPECTSDWSRCTSDWSGCTSELYGWTLQRYGCTSDWLGVYLGALVRLDLG